MPLSMSSAESAASPGPGKPLSVARNTLAQSGTGLLQYALSFLSAPILLSAVGLRSFGIWAVTGGIAQYGGLLDLGASKSLSRFVAANERDRTVCGQYVVVAITACAVMATLLLLLSLGLAGVVARGLGVARVGEVRLLMCCSVVLIACSIAATVVNGYASGHRRMVSPNIGLAIGGVLNFTAGVTALLCGAGLEGYALANAGAAVAAVLILAVIVIVREGPLPFARPSSARARDFLRYAVRIQLSWAMDVVNYQTDSLVVAFAAGPAAAGAYELANRVASAARQFALYPSSALLPALAAEYAQTGAEVLHAQYHRVTRIIVGCAFPILVFCAAVAPLLLNAWLSHVPSTTAVVLCGLSLTYMFTVAADASKVVAAAAGDPRLIARVSVFTAGLNLALTAGLAGPFGTWGVLAGTMIALSAGAIIQVTLVNGQFRLRGKDFSGPVQRTARVCLLLAVPATIIAYSHAVGGRIAEAAAVACLGATYLLAYLVWADANGDLPPAVSQRLRRVHFRRPSAATALRGG